MSLFDCPVCGRKVSDQASACPICGYQVVRKQTNTAPCVECGAAVPTSSSICQSCGYPINSARTQQPSPRERPGSFSNTFGGGSKGVVNVLAQLIWLIGAFVAIGFGFGFLQEGFQEVTIGQGFLAQKCPAVLNSILQDLPDRCGRGGSAYMRQQMLTWGYLGGALLCGYLSYCGFKMAGKINDSLNGKAA